MSGETPAHSRAETLQRFLKDTAEHKLTILREDGVYRHLRCQKPGTWCYGFDIVTWPGYLAISGDMGEAMFSRTNDMLAFFRTAEEHHASAGGLYINGGYWAEKCKANDGDRLEFTAELFEAYVKDAFDNYVELSRDDEGEGEEGAQNDPPWAAELWSELKVEVLGASEDEPTVSAAIRAMDDFKPTAARFYSDFRFHDAWEAADSLQQHTFHFTWRLYAISWAIRAYDALKADETAPAAVEVPT